MAIEQLLLNLSPEEKDKVREIARVKKTSMTSVIRSLIQEAAAE